MVLEARSHPEMTSKNPTRFVVASRISSSLSRRPKRLDQKAVEAGINAESELTGFIEVVSRLQPEGGLSPI